MDYTEIRCVGERKHTIKGIEYDVCGHLLGAVSDNTEGAIYRCSVCGTFTKIIGFDGPDLIIEDVTPQRGKKLDFTRKRRIMHGRK